MEETKCLKPPDSGHEFGDRASVQAATRVNAEQSSHGAVQVKGPHQGSIDLQLLRHSRSEPDSYDAARFPSTINLTYGRRSSRLHQNPACGAQGSGRREPFSKTAFEAMACFGSSTWIRQDGSGPGR